MKKQIIVAGSGFAGMWAALSAARAIALAGRGDDVGVTVVSPAPTLVIRPRLYEALIEGMNAADIFVTGDVVNAATDNQGNVAAMTGRTLAVTLFCLLLIPLARRFDAWDVQQWLWETWRFVRQIFPLLVVGVFLVGVIRVFILPEWIRTVAGENTILANLAGVVFGVFMYFPTLVEVPIAKMFLSLGMHPGPLIAYLMADPELSLQSILITAAIIGKLRVWTYVGLVALFSTVSGLAYGAWVDGMPLWMLAGTVGGFVVLIVGTLHLIEAPRSV